MTDVPHLIGLDPKVTRTDLNKLSRDLRLLREDLAAREAAPAAWQAYRQSEDILRALITMHHPHSDQEKRYLP